MGKRRDKLCEEEELGDTEFNTHKKHKKHKKKHKKQKRYEEGETTIEQDKPAIKLKLKIGGKTLSTKSISKSEVPVTKPKKINEHLEEQLSNEDNNDESEVGIKPSSHSTSDEEDQWLDALEKGELNHYGEIKKAKDPSLLTARQRALLGEQEDGYLLELPSGYQPSKQLTEEQLQKRQMRAQKRQQQAKEKREKEKKQTLERLLKKQENRRGGKDKGPRQQIPRLRYVSNQKGLSVSIPEGFNFPFEPQITKEVPKEQFCGVPDCENIKKYSCSKTGVPLCSLDCYKTNKALHPEKFTMTTPVS